MQNRAPLEVAEEIRKKDGNFRQLKRAKPLTDEEERKKKLREQSLIQKKWKEDNMKNE